MVIEGVMAAEEAQAQSLEVPIIVESGILEV
jgi:hypothetical protein